MKILLDECIPKRFGKLLAGHTFSTVQRCGWSGIENGNLLRLAQVEFDTFITVDQNLTFQQNLEGISITVLVLQARSNALEDLVSFVPQLLDLLDRKLTEGAIFLKT